MDWAMKGLKYLPLLIVAWLVWKLLVGLVWTAISVALVLAFIIFLVKK